MGCFRGFDRAKEFVFGYASTLEERIVQGSYTTDLLSGQSVEFGAERSQTVLDSKLALEVLSLSSSGQDGYGGLTPVSIPNANTR